MAEACAPGPYAEVIGDPIGHSLSPLIHNKWIGELGLDACFRRTRVAAKELERFLDARRADSNWRGCSVTAPHKIAILPLMDRLTAPAERIGAVNCIFREGGRLVGGNTDVDGVATALASVGLAERKAVILGAGGAAAPAVDHLLRQEAREIILLVRDPARADRLRQRAPERVRPLPISAAAVAIKGAAAVINATPLGMTGAAPMPGSVLDALASAEAGAIVLDMVYHPEKTQFLGAAEKAGLRAVGGLAMLIGQARPAFERFFGQPPPSEQDELRLLLSAAG